MFVSKGSRAQQRRQVKVIPCEIVTWAVTISYCRRPTLQKTARKSIIAKLSKNYNHACMIIFLTSLNYKIFKVFFKIRSKSINRDSCHITSTFFHIGKRKRVFAFWQGEILQKKFIRNQVCFEIQKIGWTPPNKLTQVKIDIGKLDNYSLTEQLF